jgi:hypothetical protein
MVQFREETDKKNCPSLPRIATRPAAVDNKKIPSVVNNEELEAG